MNCRAIATNPEPEDFELAGTRLIVASKPPQWIDIAGDGSLGEVHDFRVDFDFDPVGISLVGNVLYAVNSGRRIEVLEVGTDTLKRTRTLRDPLVSSPNDLVGTPDGQIYVSNMGGRMAALFNRPGGNIVHFVEGRGWSVATEPFRFGNGLLLSDDGKTLYASEFGERRLRVYDRDTGSGALTLRGFIDTGAHPDNLQWDESRRVIYAAAHRSFTRAGMHALTGLGSSPSEVRAIDVATGKNDVIFTNEGTPIAAASTGLVHRGHLYVSQIKRPRIADCTL